MLLLLHLAMSVWQNLPEEVGWCLPPPACLHTCLIQSVLVKCLQTVLLFSSWYSFVYLSYWLFLSLLFYLSWPAWMDCVPPHFLSFCYHPPCTTAVPSESQIFWSFTPPGFLRILHWSVFASEGRQFWKVDPAVLWCFLRGRRRMLENIRTSKAQWAVKEGGRFHKKEVLSRRCAAACVISLSVQCLLMQQHNTWKHLHTVIAPRLTDSFVTLCSFSNPFNLNLFQFLFFFFFIIFFLLAWLVAGVCGVVTVLVVVYWLEPVVVIKPHVVAPLPCWCFSPDSTGQKILSSPFVVSDLSLPRLYCQYLIYCLVRFKWTLNYYKEQQDWMDVEF